MRAFNARTGEREEALDPGLVAAFEALLFWGRGRNAPSRTSE